jgi:hypothetical protein
MSRSAGVWIVCLSVLVITWSPKASAYSTATSVSYSLPTTTLSGYSQTWKDPWDADAYYDCIYWVWDDSTYGWSCYGIQIQINYAAVVANVYSPEGLVYTNTVVDFSSAQASYTLPAAVPGTWTGEGYHYAVSDFYVMWCPYNFCGPPVYTGTMWFDAGYTAQSIWSLGLPTIHLLEISKHSTITLDNDKASEILAASSAILLTKTGEDDVACNVAFVRNGDVANFNTAPAEIDDFGDLIAVAQEQGLVAVVQEITWCGEPFLVPLAGCGGSEWGVIVTPRPNLARDAVVWAHEFGHYKGLGENENLGFLMYETENAANVKVTQNECDSFRTY